MADQTITEDNIRKAIRQYEDVLRSMGKGPPKEPWPCPHDKIETDPRDGARVCKRCHHQLP